MADSPTTRLRLRKQTLASNVNVWGDPYGNQTLDAIDQAVDGVTTIALAGTGTTLTSTNFATDTQRNKAYIFTGTGTGTWVGTTPAVEYVKLGVNLSSATVSLLPSAGTAGSLAPGKVGFVTSDGTTASIRGRLDQWPAPTSAVDLNSQRITGLATGTAATDAANVGQISVYSDLARDWATTTGTIVGTGTATGYSAREWAVGTSTNLDGTNLSARAYALQAGTSAAVSTAAATAAAASASAASSAVGSATRRWLGSVAGTNTLTATATPALTSYDSGLEIVYLPSNNSTGAVTINIDSLGSKSIADANAIALTSGALRAGIAMQSVYDGTQFRLVTFGGNTIRQTAYFQAPGMVPRTTNGPSSGTVEVGTRVMAKTLDYDPSTIEGAQLFFSLPDSIASSPNFTAALDYSRGTSTGTAHAVVWGVESRVFQPSDSLDQAWGSTALTTATGTASNTLYAVPASSFTPAGTVGGGYLFGLQVLRVSTATADNLPVDARLHGVRIEFDAVRNGNDA